MKKVTFEKPMSAFDRAVWSSTYKHVPPGIPVPVRVQREGKDITLRPHQTEKKD
jgi:hypothetical protein